MKGTLFEYHGNIYKILGYNGYREAIQVKLIKMKNPKLCTNEEHHIWLLEGDMWQEPFFEKATVISQEKFDLLYKDE